ncbi:MAG: cation diffusion facilitator family transporter [Sphingomonadaceae bacterium]
MTHEHTHGDPHRHSHAQADFGRAFAIGLVLNTGFVIVEVAYGLAAGSTALLADAGHNLSDVLGLVLAWGSFALARRAPTDRFTYGYRGSTILAALFNALLLLVALGGIALEAVQRILDPAPVAAATVSLVAVAGIAVNGVTAWMFAGGRRHDINIRGAYLHMLADAAISAGVAVSGLLVLWTGKAVIDPVTSLVIVAYIFWGTWGLLRQSVAMSLSAVPTHIDLAGVEAELLASPGVAKVHDLHVWHMSTTEIALTAHLVMPHGSAGDAFLSDVHERLAHNHAINHATIQIETGTDCAAHGHSCG